MRRVSSETLGWLLWGTMLGLGVAGVMAAVLALCGRWRRQVFFPSMLVSFVWWPRRWMPAWHRDWMHRGGDDLTDPWPNEPERR